MLRLAFALCLFLCPALLGARAASLWANANLNTSGPNASAGFGVVPVPLLGTFGVEGGLERPFGSDGSAFSLGVTLRDIDLPLAEVDAFAGAGLTLVPLSSGTEVRTYLEGGVHAPLLGPLGLRFGARAYPQSGAVRAGVGLEVRF